MKLAVQQNHLGSQILYRNPDPHKKRRHRRSIQDSAISFFDQKVFFCARMIFSAKNYFFVKNDFCAKKYFLIEKIFVRKNVWAEN